MKKFIARKLFFFFILAAISTQAQQWGDYTYYSTTGSTTGYLVDTNGTTFHTYIFPTGARTGYSAYVLPGGTVLRTVSRTGNSFNGGGMTGQVQKVDFNNNLVWDFVYSTTTYCMHHDVCAMPNGNVLIISYESKTATQVSAAGCSQSLIMWPEKIMEVEPQGLNGGNIVWEWHVWDHLVQNIDSTKANYQTSIVDHPELLNINYQTAKDWMHMNGIDYNVLLDQITLSSHALNEVYIIDHSTTTAEAAGHTGGRAGHGGDFLYRWGNPSAYQASGVTNFDVVHDAHWVPMDCPRANSLAAYNNDGISASQSCFDIWTPPYDGNYNYTRTMGQAYGPATYDFRHACNGHNHDLGNSQQLPNGNMLVCVAQSGYIYEIDSAQNILWSKTVAGTTPHAYRYTACYIAGTQPDTPVVSMWADTLVSSTVASTYVWYYNGVIVPGATSQTYMPAAEGGYQVQAIDAGGCASAISSPYFFIISGIKNVTDKNKIHVYPNPSTGIIKIDGYISDVMNADITVTDAIGKIILKDKNKSIIDLSDYENGIYYLSMRKGNETLLSQKIIINK